MNVAVDAKVRLLPPSTNFPFVNVMGPEWVKAVPMDTVLLPAPPVLAMSMVTFVGPVNATLLPKVWATLPVNLNRKGELEAENTPAVLLKFPFTFNIGVLPELMVANVPLPVKLKLLTVRVTG